MAEDDYINFDLDQQFSWVSAHILETSDDDDDFDVPQLQDESKSSKHQKIRRNDHGLQAAEVAAPQSNPNLINMKEKSSTKPLGHQRVKNQTNRKAAGGPGIQAIFLDSSKKSCGTGVFLPRTAGTEFPATNKPVCSPVLIPARVVQAYIPDRVVQALKLNVHQLGLHIKQPAGVNNNSRGINRKNVGSNGKKGSDVTSKTFVHTQRNSSQPAPDIFLPKEWTY